MKWIDINGFEGIYAISDNGDVKRITSKKGATAGKILKKRPDKNGYITYSLRKDGKEYPVKAHRLVATHFLVNPENKVEVNHINCIKSDNRVSNIEWVTSSENRLHAWANNLRGRTKNGISLKCSITGVTYKSIAEAAKAIGMGKNRLRCQINGIYKNQTSLIINKQ